MRPLLLALVLTLPAAVLPVAAQPVRPFVSVGGGALHYGGLRTEGLTAPYAELEAGVTSAELDPAGSRLQTSLFAGRWGGETRACSACVPFAREGVVLGARLALQPGRLPVHLVTGLSRYAVRDDTPPPLYAPDPLMPTVAPDTEARHASWGVEYGFGAVLPLGRGWALGGRGTWRRALSGRAHTAWSFTAGPSLRL